VASYEEFWAAYQRLRPPERRFYEVILRHRPCKLYFDLEFSRKANLRTPNQEERMISTLLGVVEESLKESFSAEIDYIVDLESACLAAKPDQKFSRHIIISLKD
jgi:hypothetical protein